MLVMAQEVAHFLPAVIDVGDVIASSISLVFVARGARASSMSPIGT
jgi:hypothetical protein